MSAMNPAAAKEDAFSRRLNAHGPRLYRFSNTMKKRFCSERKTGGIGAFDPPAFRLRFFRWSERWADP
jgi:hypothetical protein